MTKPTQSADSGKIEGGEGKEESGWVGIWGGRVEKKNGVC